MAEHQPITVMCNAVRLLALGDPALAGPGHNTTYWALLSLAWAAGTTLVFATLAGILYRRTSPVNRRAQPTLTQMLIFFKTPW